MDGVDAFLSVQSMIQTPSSKMDGTLLPKFHVRLLLKGIPCMRIHKMLDRLT
jgi:hypothetical protein